MFISALYVLILLISAWHDYKTREVKNRYSLFIIILSIWKVANYRELLISGLLIIPLILILGYLNCGGGDLKFIFANALYLGYENCIFALLVSMIIVILYYKVYLKLKKEEKDKNYSYPMLPFLVIGFFLFMWFR